MNAAAWYWLGFVTTPMLSAALLGALIAHDAVRAHLHRRRGTAAPVTRIGRHQ